MSSRRTGWTMLRISQVVAVQAAPAEALEVVVVGPAGVGVRVHRRRRPSRCCRCRCARSPLPRPSWPFRKPIVRDEVALHVEGHAGTAGAASSTRRSRAALAPRTLIFLLSPSTPVPVPGRGLVLELVALQHQRARRARRRSSGRASRSVEHAHRVGQRVAARRPAAAPPAAGTRAGPRSTPDSLSTTPTAWSASAPAAGRGRSLRRACRTRTRSRRRPSGAPARRRRRGTPRWSWASRTCAPGGQQRVLVRAGARAARPRGASRRCGRPSRAAPSARPRPAAGQALRGGGRAARAAHTSAQAADFVRTSMMPPSADQWSATSVAPARAVDPRRDDAVGAL